MSEKRISLEKRIETQAPQLLSLVKKAQASVDKAKLSNHQAKVALCLDISGSMDSLYASGKIQALADRVMALATRFDDDGILDIFLFGIKGHQPKPMDLSECSQYVKNMLKQYPLEPGTSYDTAIKLIRKHYFPEGKGEQRSTAVAKNSTPVYVMFLTDGDTQNESSCIQQMKWASYEPIFWKFMAIGAKASDFKFLQKLDDMEGRYIDNADFFNVPDPLKLEDSVLFDQLMEEYPNWLGEFNRKVGV
jgi:hypothetical protein